MNKNNFIISTKNIKINENLIDECIDEMEKLYGKFEKKCSDKQILNIDNFKDKFFIKKYDCQNVNDNDIDLLIEELSKNIKEEELESVAFDVELTKKYAKMKNIRKKIFDFCFIKRNVNSKNIFSVIDNIADEIYDLDIPEDQIEDFINNKMQKTENVYILV